VRLLGSTKATELLLTGDMIQAEEAKNLGLVNHIVGPEELIAKSQELLRKIAAKSPVAIKQILKLINTFNHKCDDGFKAEIDSFGKSFNTEDFKEGTSAFLEKRKPVFTGR
jgi:enoyl-CoA hydratase